MPAAVRAFGSRLHGRVPETEWLLGGIPHRTLIHGDASLNNVRTGPTVEVAFLDWEVVSSAPAVSDLAWLPVSYVSPEDWVDTVDAHDSAPHPTAAMPAALVQGSLSLADFLDDAERREPWIRRMEVGVAMARAR